METLIVSLLLVLVFLAIYWCKSMNKSKYATGLGSLVEKTRMDSSSLTDYSGSMVDSTGDADSPYAPR